MLADMLLVKVASWKPGVIMSKRYGMIFRNAELVFATCVGFGYLACAGVNLHGMPNQRIRLFIRVCVCVCVDFALACRQQAHLASKLRRCHRLQATTC